MSNRMVWIYMIQRLVLQNQEWNSDVFWVKEPSHPGNVVAKKGATSIRRSRRLHNGVYVVSIGHGIHSGCASVFFAKSVFGWVRIELLKQPPSDGKRVYPYRSTLPEYAPVVWQRLPFDRSIPCFAFDLISQLRRIFTYNKTPPPPPTAAWSYIYR